MSRVVDLCSFPALVQEFFSRYLAVERNLSRNTILSYRDALKLLLRFLSESERIAPEVLTCSEVLDPTRVRAFLRWLAEERACKASTRNQRLAALKSFARFVATRAPEHLERCPAIRELPRAREEEREVEYLDCDEVTLLVQAPDPSKPAGRRDRALLLLLHNTGARVQEVCDLNVESLRLEELPSVTIRGKGRKVRTCPLWTRTVTALRVLIASRGQPSGKAPLFLNRHGRRLTRSGVSYLLARAARKAGVSKPRHARRATPHVIRHSTAMHLLWVGADLTVIDSWLGHAQISTTHTYVTVDLRQKQEVMAAATLLPELREGVFPPPDVLTWLEKLGDRSRYAESSLPPGGHQGSRRRDST
ncbi:MAG: site-specific integrase [Planctomycetes bacterium]|nr:site-specific integrase [Planctomycetota bacterium]